MGEVLEEMEDWNSCERSAWHSVAFGLDLRGTAGFGV